MTREEAAIKVLESWRDRTRKDYAEYDVLDMAISALREQDSNKWVSVEERLPETFAPVIVCRTGGRVEAGMRDVSGWSKVYGTRTKRITHWRPLPEAPNEDL